MMGKSQSERIGFETATTLLKWEYIASVSVEYEPGSADSLDIEIQPGS